ncbi:hypothetical protein STAFG_0912 [Streptomyces afghaniensis 772]|uniref:Uncharacterized protein n=1 Tax=Streptomyces afghaniensis 772 TaxID=1283301 RepID=S4MR63_9ACTN|nr:hypothetical protein STAFG_0912 [Streptomyces afghaniensis 772]
MRIPAPRWHGRVSRPGGSPRPCVPGFSPFWPGRASRRCSGPCRSGPCPVSSCGVPGGWGEVPARPAAPRRPRYPARVKGSYAESRGLA